MDNLEEMDKFLERYNLPRLNQEEIENMNRPIRSNEIETVIKNLPTKVQDQMEGYTMFLDWKNEYCENDYTTQSNLQIQCNPCQITNGIFYRTRTKNLKIDRKSTRLNSSH